MKNINKILAVILTLALLAGSLVMAFPVGAADEFAAAAIDTWLDDNDTPTLTMGTNADVFTIAADGTTMFMWTNTTCATAAATTGAETTVFVNSTDGFPASGGTITIGASPVLTYTSATATSFVGAGGWVGAVYAAGSAVAPAVATASRALYKSINAGLTWSASSLTSPAANITMLEVSPTDLTQLIASDGTSLYRSVNGGKNWSGAVTLPIGGVIKSIDIAVGPDGSAILVGTTAGVCQFDPAMGSWSTLTANPAYAVAFSPDYINDLQVLMVVDTTGAGVMNLRTKVGTNLLDVDVAIAPIVTAPAILSAVMAFPSGYSYGTSNQVFVGIDDGVGLLGDLYRVNGVLTGGIPSCRVSGVGLDIASVAVAGTKSNSTVIVSPVNAGVMISTDADTVTTPSWTTDGIKNTINNTRKLALASTGILYAGDSGAFSGFYSATSDFLSFNGISRMEVTNIYKYGWSRGVVKDSPNSTQNSMYFWKNTTSGKWEMRLAAMNAVAANRGFQTVPSGARGAPTMYAVTNAAKNQIKKTTDAGISWTTLSSPGNKIIEALQVVNDTTYWIGYAGYIRSNTGAAIPTGTVSQTIAGITFIGKTGILVTCANNTNRIPATMLYSADNGVTFSILGRQDQWAAPTVTAWKYVVSQNKIYVVDGQTLYTWVPGSSTSWKQEDPLGIPASFVKSVDAISDVIYIGLADPAVFQVWRSLPGRFDFVAYPGTKGVDIGGTLDGLSVYDNADGSFNVKPTITTLTKIYPANIGTTLGKLYADTTFGPFKAVSPVAGAQLNNPVTITWAAAKTKGKVDYELEVARDANFDFQVTNPATENTSVLNVGGGLETGVTYYWRARVHNTRANDLLGLWSETSSFTVKTVGNTNVLGIGNADFVAPAQGATNVPLVPVLTWGVVANATYNIKLATDSSFTNVIDSKDGLTVAVYSPSKALEVNKTYFWEVQAVSGGITSDWVGFAFTTTAPPPPPATTAPPATVAPPQTIIVPTPIVNVPAATVTVNPGPTQAPATPAYIWFIIVIGAVLVIAVIVLIVRTRRV